MLRHMYGDGTMALTFYCNVLPAAIHDDLKASVSASRFQYALDRLEEHRLIYDLDPGYQRAVARLHAHICKHLTQLYIAAEQYLLTALKEEAKGWLTKFMALAWDHSAMLETVDLVLNHVSSDDALHVWLLEQVQERFVLLLREPKFNAFIPKFPPSSSRKKLAKAGRVRLKEDKTLKYCCYGDWVTGKYCYILDDIRSQYVGPGWLLKRGG